MSSALTFDFFKCINVISQPSKTLSDFYCSIKFAALKAQLWGNNRLALLRVPSIFRLSSQSKCHESLAVDELIDKLEKKETYAPLTPGSLDVRMQISVSVRLCWSVSRIPWLVWLTTRPGIDVVCSTPRCLLATKNHSP